MSEFEAKPKRSRLEALITALSIKTGPMEVPQGGSPEMDPGQWAATLAGFKGDGDLAFSYVCFLAGEPYHRKHLIGRLIYLLSPRVLMRMPDLTLSGADLRDVVSVTIDAERHGGRVTLADAERSGIKRKRWDRLKPVHVLVSETLDDLTDQIVRHLHRNGQVSKD